MFNLEDFSTVAICMECYQDGVWVIGNGNGKWKIERENWKGKWKYEIKIEM